MKYTMKQHTIIIYTLVMVQGLLGARILTSQSSQCNGDDLLKASNEIFDALHINLPMLISTQQNLISCRDWLSLHVNTTTSQIKAKQSEDEDNVCYQSLLDRLSHLPENYDEELQAYDDSKAEEEVYKRLHEGLEIVLNCFREKSESSSCPEIVKCYEGGKKKLYEDKKFTPEDIQDFLRDYNDGLDETCKTIGTVEFDTYKSFKNNCKDT
ncbi:hypothetical protein RI129_009186 [Pyrocoelia pectoralis]|uniref:Uncharacterized protein n=1 Tax=Pyrocoelia pectoralis TaxID=417401 RepID=A0AAN7VFI2_9COLE